jgi:hypothetical protein
MVNWATVASFATAGGTLVLAVATFSAVRSSGRSARIAEEGLLTSLRPLLVPSFADDPVNKLLWQDFHRARLGGGQAILDHENDVFYLALGLRNAGAGIALLHGWYPFPDRAIVVDLPHGDPDDFRRLTIDLYIPAGGTGYFEAAVRDPDDPLRGDFLGAVTERRPFTVELLYGDQQGRQRSISRFTVLPTDDGSGWFCRATRHWNLDGPAPR